MSDKARRDYYTQLGKEFASAMHGKLQADDGPLIPCEKCETLQAKLGNSNPMELHHVEDVAVNEKGIMQDSGHVGMPSLFGLFVCAECHRLKPDCIHNHASTSLAFKNAGHPPQYPQAIAVHNAIEFLVDRLMWQEVELLERETRIKEMQDKVSSAKVIEAEAKRIIAVATSHRSRTNE